MYLIFNFLTFAVAFFVGQASPPSHIFEYKNGSERIVNFQLLEDSSGTISIDSIVHSRFGSPVAVLKHPTTFNWIKINIKNASRHANPLLVLRNPSLEDVLFYQYDEQEDKVLRALHAGVSVPFADRPNKSVNYVVKLKLNKGDSTTVFIRIRTNAAAHIPLYIGDATTLMEESSINSIFIGLYIGIICIMFFYNLFVFFSVRDRSYLYYIFYIFSVGLTQLIINGYAFKYFWPNNVWLAVNAYNLSGVLSGIATAFFVQSFLSTKRIVPKLHRLFNLMILGYLVATVFSVTFSRSVAFDIINSIGLIGSVIAIFTGFYIAKLGNRAAYFFLVAFSVFLLSVIVHILTSSNVLPYTLFTQNILEIGSSLQILLLSLALADKINVYRDGQEKAKQEALATSVENERLVRDQNTMLEQQVRERTRDLENANTSLNNTLLQLRNAQSKLVESEKMVSLGQLTAGIAHEINNPINFVTSNVKPLELDINDLVSVIDKYETLDTNQNVVEQIAQVNAYKSGLDINYLKEEIQTLLNGIKEGAQRTAEIVSNLKNFARIDEINMKYVNLNQGIDSTLMLVKNSFPKDFVINKELATIPNVECMPGKINQVFMNIITNGLQSIVERQTANPEKGILTIKTFQEGNKVKISIKDNGTGIKESVKEKLFDPFFTTKPVGHGTGLGMSIVKGIMDTHNGTIEVISNFGEGAEFIITLPVNNH